MTECQFNLLGIRLLNDALRAHLGQDNIASYPPALLLWNMLEKVDAAYITSSSNEEKLSGTKAL